MVLAIILMMIGDSNKVHWVVFTRSLQLIIFMALINIPISPLFLDLLKAMHKIAFFDLIGEYNIWSYLTFLKLNDNNVPFINLQMQTI